MNTETREQDFMKAFNRCDFGYKPTKNPGLNPEALALEKIIAQYEDSLVRFSGSSEFYEDSLGRLIDIEYTQETVLAFSRNFKEDNYLGIYISALINNIIQKDEEIIIQPKIPLEYIGFNHSKGTLIIEGDVGYYTGERMSGGEIVVKGSAANWTGELMSGGKITVEKDAANFTGSNMYNGEIVVKGNLGEFTGPNMEGGKITVNGRIKSLWTDIYGGEIWQKGKKVYPK